MWMMTQGELKRYYDGPYREAIKTANVADCNISEQLQRAEKLISFMDDIIPNNVLDIGSSTGMVLKVLRDTYECDILGVELCSRFSEFSRKIGVPTVNDIDQVNGRKFDMVTILHTLEHLTEPMAILNRVRELIAENGTLWVEVPLMGYRLSHPTVFTEETLEKMLNKAGFVIERKTVDKKNILVEAHRDT